MANLAISAMAVLLNELFGGYEQPISLEDAEKVSTGQVILPIVAYGPKAIQLKTTAIKNTFCNARLAVYSKQPDNLKQCLRFINKEREITKQQLIDNIPTSVREAHFDFEGIYALINVLSSLEGIKSDRVSFFYNPCPGEGIVTHCVAVIHEFGEEGNPFCVATTYFSIEIGK